MNENNTTVDAYEPRRDGDSAEPHTDEPRRVSDEAEAIEQELIAEEPVAADHEESAQALMAGNAPGAGEAPRDGEGTAETADQPADAYPPEETEGDAGASSDEDHAPQGGGDESQQRRVTLEAGTDEESLKALALCREKVSQLHLRMHPLAARWEGDRHVIIFFRADEKVDFRKLVRELSRLLHARIELRQVGPREQGKLCGLVGKCGYPLCCQTFLTQFAQSTIKMAKTQELALNPMKISGVCGRLLCCLNYEQQMYLEARANMPRVNKMVDTELGPGRVVAVNVLKQTITVQLETATRELRLDQVRPPEPQG